ncbi:prohead protease/major capsid protein fusion protein [Stakelama tenebrarum]|uniref:Bacteriophage Mu GpT domain-containing protein n=1 Tax=Stakelama tenebrarum TaxID=2711215 RepID=A0A6G6Y4V4_9SPHN|nr:prohead protease/major capsid protein fusion protein [Sphingosinithalassobacter tenebrarum]QIG79984.1 hypothetical protein G5C33_09485 [Sphingosinithalassobacter tenebrarum]
MTNATTAEAPAAASLAGQPVEERLVQSEMATRPMVTQPASWDAEARTIDVTFTTGARGARFNWSRFEMIDEELATDDGAVRLDRMNNGAAVLNTHRQYDLENQIGVVVPGSARMENGEGIATVQLSGREELASIVADIGAGLIRNISVGYIVHTYEVTERDGARALYRATDWEPVEISFVPVPFDAGAQVRSNRETEQGGHPCTIRRTLPASQENDDMTTAPTQAASGDAAVENRSEQSGGAATQTAPQPPAQNPPAPPEHRQQSETVKRFSAGVAMRFMDMARPFGEGMEAKARLLIDQNERGEISVETAWERLGEASGEAQRAATGGISTGGRPIAVSGQNEQATRGLIVDAIVARCTGAQPGEGAREYMDYSLLDIARSRAGLSPRERDATMIMRAANTSSDFPLLLEAAANKLLLARYQLATPTYRAISRRKDLTDFKETKLLRVGDFPTLKPYQEDGEIKSGTINEGRETVILGSYGRILRLSRQAIVNDDMGAFDEVFATIGDVIAQFENATFFAMKGQNNGAGPKLSDGKAVFHADHGNLAASGGAIDVTTVGAGRAAMRKQENIDGNTMNVAPKFMLVGADEETNADKFLASVTPTQSSEVNPFSGKLTPVVDATVSGNAWELYADPAQLPVFHYGYLRSAPGPRVMMEEPFNVDGMAWRVTLDFYAGATDYRGAYRNPYTGS